MTKQLESARAISAANRKAKLECKNGHKYTDGSYQVVRDSKGNMSRSCLACLRVNRSKWRKNVAQKNTLPKEKIEIAIFEMRENGKTLSNLFGFKDRKYVKGIRVFQREQWLGMKQDFPKLANKMVDLSRKNTLVIRHAARSRKPIVAAPAMLRNNGIDAYESVRLACRGVYEDIRSDVETLMFLAIAEGRLKLKDTSARVREFVAEHNKQNRHSVMSRYGDRSLDAALNDDGFSLMDTIQDGAGWVVPINTGRHVSIKGGTW